jgi:hypothetical protein
MDYVSPLSARQIMLDLPPITGISVACQAREESQRNGHQAASAKSRSKEPASASGAAAMVATPLPANSAAAKSEIIVARASGTTSVAQVRRVECMKANPPPTSIAAALTLASDCPTAPEASSSRSHYRGVARFWRRARPTSGPSARGPGVAGCCFVLG